MSLELLEELMKIFSAESIVFGVLSFMAGFVTAVVYQDKKTKQALANLQKKEEQMAKELEEAKARIKEKSDEELLNSIIKPESPDS